MEVRDAVLRQLREERMLENSDSLICAFSGGADSVCLAHILWSLAPELGVRFSCAHFNHCLRGEESERDEQFVLHWCEERGIPLYRGSGDVRTYARERHMGLEEAARTLRYAFLDGLGNENTRIATAHHADDAAETILLNLIRGTGPKGLIGIPLQRGRYIRPLLQVTHEEALDYLAAHSLEHMEDSSNAEDNCRRNILRHSVLPLLRKMNPEFSRGCVRTGQLLRADHALLEQQAATLLTETTDMVCLPVTALCQAEKPVASRAVRQAAAHFSVSLENQHTEAVLRLVSSGPSAELNLPNGLCVKRVYDELRFLRPKPAVILQETELPFGQWVQPAGTELSVYVGDLSEAAKVHGNFTCWFFKKSCICGTIKVRPRTAGDCLKPVGRACRKTLKKWMIELRIPAEQRNTVPVIADEMGVLAVPGIGPDERAFAAEESADAVIIISERT